MAGHCIRHPELLASDLVLWEPMHGRAQQGRPRPMEDKAEKLQRP